MIKKLKASTFVEVLVALVLVMLSFGLAISVFTSVVSSNRSLVEMKARAGVAEALEQMYEDGAFLDELIENDDYSLDIKFSNTAESETNLQLLNITAKNNKDQLLFEEQRYILTK